MTWLAVLAATCAVALLLPTRRELRAVPVGQGRASPGLPPMPLVAGLSAGAAVLLLGPPLSTLLAVVAALGAARVVARLEPASLRRRRARLEAALPHVVDLMATCLAAGASPTGALQQVALAVDPPIREELAAFEGRLSLGADPRDVWTAMARHPQLGPLGRALVRAVETGASVSDALTRLAAELRAQRRAEVEAMARTIEVKASLPLGLCLLPAFVLVGIVPLVAGSFSLTFLAGRP